MMKPSQAPTSILRGRFGVSAFALALFYLLITIATQAAQAQTFTVLHNFTGGPDGGWPQAGLTLDRAGNLYGTTTIGGNAGCSYGEFPGCGSVFKLAHHASGWTLNTLYAFAGGSDGDEPLTPVVLGSDGNLYGTTALGGYACDFYGCGTVFKLQPQPTVCQSASCPWRKTEVYQFTGASDGAYPATGSLTFDAAGNIYGTSQGMTNQILDAVVYKLTPSINGWTFNALYTFPGGNEAGPPYAGVVFDSHGNLWGTTNAGGLDQCGGLPLNETCGILFQLTPSGSGWTENTVKQFDLQSGGNPYGNLIVDPSGNIYGTDSTNGPNGGGSVYQLNPGTRSLNVLYGFTGNPSAGGGPLDGLAMDASGNLYGTTYIVGAHQAGQVFKLTPSGAGWIYTDLHDFTGGSDGAYPLARVAVDSSGNVYGIALQGGSSSNCRVGCGVVWQITP